MKIALFSDVHANLPALEAVLADMNARQLDLVYCLGDLVGYASFPTKRFEKSEDGTSQPLPGIMTRASV